MSTIKEAIAAYLLALREERDALPIEEDLSIAG